MIPCRPCCAYKGTCAVSNEAQHLVFRARTKSGNNAYSGRIAMRQAHMKCWGSGVPKCWGTEQCLCNALVQSGEEDTGLYQTLATTCDVLKNVLFRNVSLSFLSQQLKKGSLPGILRVNKSLRRLTREWETEKHGDKGSNLQSQGLTVLVAQEVLLWIAEFGNCL